MATDQFDLPTTFIDSSEVLADALPCWFAANILAVDIECSLTGFHHCVLALLQIATHDHVWLMDPLAVPELVKPALAAMAKVPWIVHDFSGDGIVFKRIYDVIPSLVMDTMLLARCLGYPNPGLKRMAKVKLGLDISKDEQGSNWLHRPLRKSQVIYAARDASILLPLLRTLAEEVETKRIDPVIGPRLSRLPHEIKQLMARIQNYQTPESNSVLDAIRRLGLDEEVIEIANRITKLRHDWGNHGDVAAVMELGNKWIVARLTCPPKSKEDLRVSICNPYFSKAHLDDLWVALSSRDLKC